MNDTNRKSEFVIGLVAPVGVDLDIIQNSISDYINQFGYKENLIKLSSIIKEVPGIETPIKEDNIFEKIGSLMTAGNEIREKTNSGAMIAVLSILKINELRTDNKPLGKTIHILRSLKHPEEVMELRKVYSHGFFLLGLSSSFSKRLDYLMNRKDMKKEEAEILMLRDEDETKEFGQRTRDVFHLADGFVDIDATDASDQIRRIFDLLFGHPYITPTKDENAMHIAFASSLRSADLSRQVGAVVVSKSGEIISTGANDVPRFGGGLYWSDDKDDMRDFKRRFDSNERRRNEIVKAIMKKVGNCEDNDEKIIEEGREILKDTGVLDITEYGRAVHAEMEALLACARIGISPVNGTLICTTFPCHNCAKHIVAAGIQRVVFVEPYPKSRALELHDDSIALEHRTEEDEINNKVKFQPFVGVGTRRFFDLFSMKLSSGYKLKREDKGEIINWTRKDASLRVPLVPLSYIEQEGTILSEFYTNLEKLKN